MLFAFGLSQAQAHCTAARTFRNLVERLELRRLLSVTITGSPGDDNINVALGAGNALVVNLNGTTTTYTPAQYAGGITIDTAGSAGGGHDTLQIGSLPNAPTHVRSSANLNLTIGTDARGLQDVAGAIDLQSTVNDILQYFNVTVDDAGDPVARHASIGSVLLPGTQQEVDVIHGLSPADITFPTAVEGGCDIGTGGGADTLDVTIAQRTPPVGIFVNGPGTQVNNQDRPALNADMRFSGGKVVVDGKPRSVSLLVDESLMRSWALSVATASFGDTGEVGNLDYSAAAVGGPVMIHGGGAGNTISIDDTPANEIVDVSTGAGADTLNIQSTGPGSILNVNGQGGEDSVTVDGGNFGSGLAQFIRGVLNVANASGHTHLTINDFSDTTSRTAILDTFTAGADVYGSLTGLSPAPINFDSAQVASPVVINAGDAGNHFVVNHTPPATVVNLNTGNGADTMDVHATGTGSVLNINGQNGHDAVSIADLDQTVSGILGPVNVSNPLGATDLVINDSGEFPGRTPAVTLDTFTAGGTTYGTLQGLAPAPINFAGTGLHSLAVDLSGITAPALTVNNTPGGGAITFLNLATATVNGTAPGQSLTLDVSEFQEAVTLNFSTGRIGDGSHIDTPDCIDLIINGASPSDQFVNFQHGHTVITFDTSVLDRIWLQTGSFLITQNLSGQAAYELIANGPGTRLTYEADQGPYVGLEIRGGAHVALANGITARFPGFPIQDGTLDIGTGQLFYMYSAADLSLRTQIASGLAGGPGITSSAADVTHGVGYSASGGHVKWALYGDTNLDGKVDFNDLLTLAQNYGRTDADWYHGDFNYDGKIDFADLLKVGQNFGRTTPTIAAVSAGVNSPQPLDLPALKRRRVHR